VEADPGDLEAIAVMTARIAIDVYVHGDE